MTYIFVISGPQTPFPPNPRCGTFSLPPPCLRCKWISGSQSCIRRQLVPKLLPKGPNVVSPHIVDVEVAGKFNSSGPTWGIVVGVSGLAGMLFYDSDDTLLSTENDFYMVTIFIGFAGASIVFVIDGNIVGFLALGATGVDLAFAYGKFTWL